MKETRQTVERSPLTLTKSGYHSKTPVRIVHESIVKSPTRRDPSPIIGNRLYGRDSRIKMHRGFEGMSKSEILLAEPHSPQKLHDKNLSTVHEVHSKMSSADMQNTKSSKFLGGDDSHYIVSSSRVNHVTPERKIQTKQYSKSPMELPTRHSHYSGYTYPRVSDVQVKRDMENQLYEIRNENTHLINNIHTYQNNDDSRLRALMTENLELKSNLKRLTHGDSNLKKNYGFLEENTRLKEENSRLSKIVEELTSKNKLSHDELELLKNTNSVLNADNSRLFADNKDFMRRTQELEKELAQQRHGLDATRNHNEKTKSAQPQTQGQENEINRLNSIIHHLEADLAGLKIQLSQKQHHSHQSPTHTNLHSSQLKVIKEVDTHEINRLNNIIRHLEQDLAHEREHSKSHINSNVHTSQVRIVKEIDTAENDRLKNSIKYLESDLENEKEKNKNKYISQHEYDSNEIDRLAHIIDSLQLELNMERERAVQGIQVPHVESNVEVVREQDTDQLVNQNRTINQLNNDLLKLRNEHTQTKKRNVMMKIKNDAFKGQVSKLEKRIEPQEKEIHELKHRLEESQHNESSVTNKLEEFKINYKQLEADYEILQDKARLDSSQQNGLMKSIAQLNKENAQLRLEKNSLIRDINELKKQLSSKEQTLGNESRLSHDLKNNLEQKDMDIAKLKKELERQKADSDNEITRLKEYYKTEIHHITEHWKNEIIVLGTNHKTEIHKLEINWKSEINNGRSSHKDESTKLENHWKNEVYNVENKYKTEITNIENHWKTEIHNWDINHKTVITNIENKHKKEMADLKNELYNVENHYKNEITHIENHWKTEIHNLDTSHKTVITNIENKHKKEIADLKNEQSQVEIYWKNEIHTMQFNHKQVITDLENKHKKEMADLKRQYQIELDKLYYEQEDEIKKLRQEIEKLQNAYTVTYMELQRDPKHTKLLGTLPWLNLFSTGKNKESEKSRQPPKLVIGLNFAAPSPGREDEQYGARPHGHGQDGSEFNLSRSPENPKGEKPANVGALAFLGKQFLAPRIRAAYLTTILLRDDEILQLKKQLDNRDIHEMPNQQKCILKDLELEIIDLRTDNGKQKDDLNTQINFRKINFTTEEIYKKLMITLETENSLLKDSVSILDTKVLYNIERYTEMLQKEGDKVRESRVVESTVKGHRSKELVTEKHGSSQHIPEDLKAWINLLQTGSEHVIAEKLGQLLSANEQLTFEQDNQANAYSKKTNENNELRFRLMKIEEENQMGTAGGINQNIAAENSILKETIIDFESEIRKKDLDRKTLDKQFQTLLLEYQMEAKSYEETYERLLSTIEQQKGVIAKTFKDATEAGYQQDDQAKLMKELYDENQRLDKELYLTQNKMKNMQETNQESVNQQLHQLKDECENYKLLFDEKDHAFNNSRKDQVKEQGKVAKLLNEVRTSEEKMSVPNKAAMTEEQNYESGASEIKLKEENMLLLERLEDLRKENNQMKQMGNPSQQDNQMENEQKIKYDELAKENFELSEQNWQFQKMHYDEQSRTFKEKLDLPMGKDTPAGNMEMLQAQLLVYETNIQELQRESLILKEKIKKLKKKNSHSKAKIENLEEEKKYLQLNINDKEELNVLGNNLEGPSYFNILEERAKHSEEKKCFENKLNEQNNDNNRLNEIKKELERRVEEKEYLIKTYQDMNRDNDVPNM